MLYALHHAHRGWLDPLADLAAAAAARTAGRADPLARWLHAGWALVDRLGRRYDRRPFGIDRAAVAGREVEVVEEVVEARPFCALRRFARRAPDGDPALAAALARGPRVLVCAPLSGHHATLLRDTVATLLREHDVYLTDWTCARQVPVAAGPFRLADYVAYVQGFVRRLQADGPLHVVSVCQPTVPVLAALALMATAGEPTPASLTLMGGPIDARVNPTAVNRLATTQPIAWFRHNAIHRVPAGFPGAGREVYPGFLQLAAFVMMNPARHAEAYRDFWLDRLRGAPTDAHERFYDEYNAVLDLDAAYYLDTVEQVFQRFELARGTWAIDGAPVRPADLTATALMTVEGDADDISGLGQTAAAHRLCAGVPDARRRHLVARCGHYGLFSGSRWRDEVYPAVRAFIAAHHPSAPAAAEGAAAAGGAP